ncbi:hypothetical protein Q7O_003684 [Pectobacterium carotovorum subsp. carotovorum PCCS1]|nr:hypothetical protein [Pectobacterium carotovorum subsp. carotovorum PCCS1]
MLQGEIICEKPFCGCFTMSSYVKRYAAVLRGVAFSHQ